MIDNLSDHYAARAARLSVPEVDPSDLPDANIWQTQRPEVHQQFMLSLGLDRLPPPCDLRPTVTGRFEGEGYTAEKLTYQLLPDVWGSAHVYRPASLAVDERAPAVLYACGHHKSGVVGYQHHAIAWARRGYICLIFDTIEQHDNPGEHHGLHSGRCPQWISMGYTAAGGEVFNGMRALDLLLEQPGVDPDRVGVTGISGGGSQSFRLAAADQRVRAVATVAGISDPAFAIANRTVEQHCDCMYEHNRFARDVSVWGALIAPRPLLFAYARHDNLFTPDEFRALHQRTQARYARLGVADRCRLEEYDGPHGYNHKSTCDAIHCWFDQHVAGKPHPDMDTLAIQREAGLHDEPTLSVFHGVTPEPNRLHLLPDLLSHRGQVRLPDSPEHWQWVREEIIVRLRSRIFHLLDDVAQPQTIAQVGDSIHDGDQRLEWRGQLDGMSQSIVLLTGQKPADHSVVIAVGDRAQHATALSRSLRQAAGGTDVGGVGIEPRAAGRSAPHPSHGKLLLRQGALVGLTPTMMMIQDLHHLWPKVTALPPLRAKDIYLYGRGEGAVAMLYHALLHPDPAVKGVILANLPRSHDDGEYPILGIRTVLDLAHAVGLLAPLPVILIANRGTSFDWYWADRAHARLTKPSTLATAASLPAALTRLTARTNTASNERSS